LRKKNYFRHINTAHQDEKIQSLIQHIGYEGYAYYFILLEMCSNQAKTNSQTEFLFNLKALETAWNKRSDGVKSVLNKMTERGLIETIFKSSLVHLSIPNLLKYKGNKKLGKPKCDTKVTLKRQNSTKKTQSLNICHAEFSSSPMRNILTTVKIDLQNKWVEIYGTEFLLEEFKKMYIWLEANSNKAPKTNFGKFITNWLDRGWERSRKGTTSAYVSKAQQRQDYMMTMPNPFEKDGSV
jgi:hypothetical protein